MGLILKYKEASYFSSSPLSLSVLKHGYIQKTNLIIE